MSYRELGYDAFMSRTIESYQRQTPLETRVTYQPGALIADGVRVSSETLLLSVDKDGIYLGSMSPTYEEGRLYYDWTNHKLMIGGASGFETVTSV